MIADASPGSRVSVGNFGVTYEGTFLSGGPEGVKLMNCISREAVPGPNGQTQLKTSHVPEETFKTSSMTRFVVISPPPAEFVPPDLSRDTSGLTVYDIVYRDGTRQRREIPAIPDKSDLATGSVEQE